MLIEDDLLEGQSECLHTGSSFGINPEMTWERSLERHQTSHGAAKFLFIFRDKGLK
jgi:hypothetical protein